MNARAFKVYAEGQKEASVQLSAPVDLIIIIYERLIEHCRDAKREIADDKDPVDSVTKAVDLISDGLQGCLDFQKGGQIATNLRDLYEWCVIQLVGSRITRKVESVESVERVLSDLLIGWRGLSKK